MDSIIPIFGIDDVMHSTENDLILKFGRPNSHIPLWTLLFIKF